MSLFSMRWIHQRFLYAMFGLVLFTFAFCFFYGASLYHSELDHQESQESEQAEILKKEFTMSLNYISDLMRFIGSHAEKNGKPALTEVTSLLQGPLVNNDGARDFFSWAMMDWSTPDQKMRSSTRMGILSTPLDISYRAYAQAALSKPGILHFDEPDIGISSKKWVIPAGIGITGKNGAFLGIVSTGLNVESMRKRLEAVAHTPHVRFALFDAHQNLIFFSPSEHSESFASLPKIDISSALELQGTTRLSQPLRFANSTFTYVAQLDGYPFLFLVGREDGAVFQAFWSRYQSFALVMVFLLLGILAAGFWLHRSVAVPFSAFTKNIDIVSRRGRLSRLEEKKTLLPEMRALLGNMLLFRRTTERSLLKYKQKIIAWQRKEELYNHIHYRLRSVLKTMTLSLDVVEREKNTSRDPEMFGCMILSMRDCIAQIGCLVLSEGTSSKVDIHLVIKNSLTISRIKADFEKVTLVPHIPATLPPLEGDDIKLQQIIISTLSHAIECTSAGGVVEFFVSIDTHADGTAAHLVISIKDNGLGLTEKERQDKWNEIQQMKHIYPTRDTVVQLDLQVIGQLVDVHAGSFEMLPRFGKGTTFTIKLPYDDITHTEPRPKKTSTRTASSHIRASKRRSNVVPFMPSGT